MRVPDFFIAGAAKAGTTSLFWYLNEHPDLFLSTIDKEPGYYCDFWGLQSEEEYARLFADAKPSQMTGEASTPYLSCPASPRLIHEANPDAKIMILLRNPAKRAYSLYNWMVNKGNEWVRPFERALELEGKRKARDPNERLIRGYYYNYLYFHSGLYHDQVKRYFDIFPRDQVKVFLFEDLVENAQAVADASFKLLGVDPVKVEPEVHNPAGFPKSVLLQYFLKKGVEDTFRRLRVPVGGRLTRPLMDMNQRAAKPPPVRSDTYNKLVADYREDVEKTADLIGRDLGRWLEPMAETAAA